VREGFAKDGLTGFELATALAVVAAGDGVLHHGVADDDAGLGERRVIHRDVLYGERAGVEQKGVSGAGGSDDELVHNAAGRVYVTVFSALTKKSDLGGREGNVCMSEESYCGCDFDRCRGTEARTEGDIPA